MNTRNSKLAVLLLGLLFIPSLGFADIACDGTDDGLSSTTAMSTFMSASTGSMTIWYTPTGTASNGPDDACWAGEPILGETDAGGAYFGLNRHGNYSGNDRLCGWNYSTFPTIDILTAYTNNAATHLALTKGGGTLSFYKDGTLVSSSASGDTLSMIALAEVCGLNNAGSSYPTGEGTIARPQFFSVTLSANEIAGMAGSRSHWHRHSQPTGSWALDNCGTSADGVTLYDETGNNRSFTGNNGANNTGLTCVGNTMLSYPWGVE